MNWITALAGRARAVFDPSTETHAAPEPRAEDPLALYLDGSGRMHPIKADTGYYGEPLQRTALGYLMQNAEQYARASIASVWAANCINLRADTLARLEWYVQDRRTHDRVPNHPFEVAMRRSPQNIVRKLEWALLTWGECFFRPLQNQYGYYSDLRWLNNLSIDMDTTPGYVRQIVYTPPGGRKKLILSPRHGSPNPVIFLKTDNPYDDLRGLSKFEHVLLEIQIDQHISRTTHAWYINDARPGLLLLPETDLPDKEAQEFVDFWNAQFKNPQNKGRVGVAPKRIREVRDLNQSPNIDDVELRESTRREICAAFKVPLSLAGAWDDATYQSLPEQRKAFYEETIIPEAEFIARDLTQAVLPYFDDNPAYEIVFDAETILALIENVQEKTDIATTQLQAGGITVNEYREAIGYDAVPGGNIYLMQPTVIPVQADKLAEFEPVQTAAPPALPAPPPSAPPPEPERSIIRSTGKAKTPGGQAVIEPPFPAQFGSIHDGMNIDGDEPSLPPTHIPESVRGSLFMPQDTQEVTTIHAAALAELKAWRKFHKNGTDRPFATYMVLDDIAVELREQLQHAGDNPAAVDAAFTEAEQRARVKALGSTQNQFESDIATLIHDARRKTVGKRQFTRRLENLIALHGEQLFRDGLADGGVIVPAGEELDIEDVARIQMLLNEQLPFAENLATRLYDEGISDALASQKPRQWFGKTMMPFYDSGLLSAARNEMVEFTGPIDSNSCATCKALVGQRHRRRTFAANGFMPPYGRNIICSDGGLCKHRLTNVAGRARGSLARVPRHG